MNTFSDKLLEAKGFENHYVIRALGGATKQGMTGRIPAIGRKRGGPIDVVLTQFPKFVERLTNHYEFSDYALSIIDWGVSGAIEDTGKQTTSLHLESALEPMMEGDVDAEPRVIGSMVMLETIEYARMLTPGEALTLSEDEEEEAEEDQEALSEHPVYALLHEIRMALFLNKCVKFLGQDDRLEPEVWYFATEAEKPQYFMLTLDREVLEHDLSLIMEQ